jgi:hypothetical protein
LPPAGRVAATMTISVMKILLRGRFVNQAFALT